MVADPVSVRPLKKEPGITEFLPAGAETVTVMYWPRAIDWKFDGEIVIFASLTRRSVSTALHAVSIWAAVADG